MIRYNKRIMYYFIDETDDNENNYLIIWRYWPNKLNYYQTFIKLNLDLYSDTTSHVFNYKTKPFLQATTFKNSYLDVVVI